MKILESYKLSDKTRSILEKYDVDFAFQPIYSRFETIVGYEALMRPKGKFILDFIEEMKSKKKLHELEILTFFGANRCINKEVMIL